MSTSPILLFHIACATLGLISGYLAMTLRKGPRAHAAAGTVFFWSMLGMGLSGAYISTFLRPIMINVVAGLLASYLVLTGRRAARNHDGSTGAADLLLMLMGLAIGILGIVSGALAVENGGLHGVPAPIYFIFGTIALLGGIFDLRLLVRGGVTGVRRLFRHLWRMGLALMLASFSLYPGQAKLFPMSLRETKLLFVPHILLIGSLLFWSARMSARRRRAVVGPPARTQSLEAAA